MLRGTETKLSRPEALSTKPTPACRKPSKHGFPFGYPCLPRTHLAPKPKPKLRTYAAGRSRLDIGCAELGFAIIPTSRPPGKPEPKLSKSDTTVFHNQRNIRSRASFAARALRNGHSTKTYPQEPTITDPTNVTGSTTKKPPVNGRIPNNGSTAPNTAKCHRKNE